MVRGARLDGDCPRKPADDTGAKLGAKQEPIDWTEADVLDGKPDKTPGQRTGRA